MSELSDSYKGAADVIRRYWRMYGGLKSILYSPYAHLSLLLLIPTYRLWLSERWWSMALSILPSLLGFSLAGFAVFLAFGSDEFKRLIGGVDESRSATSSPFMSVASAFAHFVVVQVVALLFAICAEGLSKVPIVSDQWLGSVENWMRMLGWGFGFWLFLYAICLAVAALFAIFRAASWFDAFLSNHKNGR